MQTREPWQMTKKEWMAFPRRWEETPRLLTVDEWRASNGFSNPLDDHGDFRHPHGISNATKKRIAERTAERGRSVVAGVAAYQQALDEDRVPMVIKVREIRADGLDTESSLAAARVYHKRQVAKAYRDGLSVPARVLADYPRLTEGSRAQQAPRAMVASVPSQMLFSF